MRGRHQVWPDGTGVQNLACRGSRVRVVRRFSGRDDDELHDLHMVDQSVSEVVLFEIVHDDGEPVVGSTLDWSAPMRHCGRADVDQRAQVSFFGRTFFVILVCAAGKGKMNRKSAFARVLPADYLSSARRGNFASLLCFRAIASP